MSANANAILIVDDDWITREVMQATLESAGYRVFEASSGARALELLAESPPDLILLDVRMPGLDGFETCQRIKANPRTQHIPVLLMTGLEHDDAKQRALEAGVDDFITKPFDMITVQARVRSLLRVKTLYDTLQRREQRLREILAAEFSAETVERILRALDIPPAT